MDSFLCPSLRNSNLNFLLLGYFYVYVYLSIISLYESLNSSVSRVDLPHLPFLLGAKSWPATRPLSFHSFLINALTPNNASMSLRWASVHTPHTLKGSDSFLCVQTGSDRSSSASWSDSRSLIIGLLIIIARVNVWIAKSPTAWLSLLIFKAPTPRSGENVTELANPGESLLMSREVQVD